MLKKIGLFLLKPFDAFLGRIFSVAGAIVFSQFPHFVEDYLQRLGGHLDEIKRVLAQYESAARATGKTLQEFVSIHMNSNSPEIVKSGQIISDHLTRAEHLSKAYDAVSHATPFTKCFSFLRYADWDISKATLANYTPGLALSLEGVAYACAGIIIGMIIYFAIKAPVKGIFDRSLDKNKQGW